MTEAEVLEAQQLWADQIAAISKVYADKGDYVAAPAAVTAPTPITEQEVEVAQKLWADQIAAISKVYLDGGDYVTAAGEAAGQLYGYGHGDVLFKPTKATGHPFRPTGEEAMSYFVGAEAMKNDEFKGEDAGFAINGGKGWKEVVFRNHQAQRPAPLPPHCCLTAASLHHPAALRGP